MCHDINTANTILLFQIIVNCNIAMCLINNFKIKRQRTEEYLYANTTGCVDE